MVKGAIRVNEPTCFGVVVSTLQVVEAGFNIVNIASIAEEDCLQEGICAEGGVNFTCVEHTPSVVGEVQDTGAVFVVDVVGYTSVIISPNTTVGRRDDTVRRVNIIATNFVRIRLLVLPFFIRYVSTFLQFGLGKLT